MMDIIEQALKNGLKSLSEHQSKEVLKDYGVPVTKEILVHSREEALSAAKEIGYPLVMKACSPTITHKSEKGLIRIDLRGPEEVSRAFQELRRNLSGDGEGILVQEMIKGGRELLIGMIRDPQFGPCVMFGLGGIFTEVLRDVCFRVAPLNPMDAHEMMNEIRANRILDAVRGYPPVNRERLAEILVNIGNLGMEVNQIKEIDINPVLFREDQPVAVDALVVLE